MYGTILLSAKACIKSRFGINIATSEIHVSKPCRYNTLLFTCNDCYNMLVYTSISVSGLQPIQVSHRESLEVFYIYGAL